MFCLPLEGERRPTRHADFGAQSLSALFPNCLHLKNNVTAIPPKLATSDAATSYWMRFPLINLYTLLGVPFVLPIHNQGASSANQQGHALRRKFLPATSSFFVTTLLIQALALQHLSADASCNGHGCFVFESLCRLSVSCSRMPDVSEHL